MLEVPSGRVLSHLDLQIVRQFHEHGFVRWTDEPITLKSGIESYVYVFGREDLTDNSELEWLLGRKIALLIQEKQTSFKQPCLIGIPTAGTPLAQAAAMVSFREGILVNGQPICHRTMREVLKEHGVHQNWVNGVADPARHCYWDVDNVVTDAGSKFESRGRFKESGYPVEEMPSFVTIDRQQGGIQSMIQGGIKQIAIAYYLLDVIHAFVQLDLWPKERMWAVEKEISAHRS